MEPKVAIIILNWNGLEDTIECVDSIMKLTYPNHVVVVVDNGSDGNDVQILKEQYGQCIYLIENGKNYGYAEGNNIGIRLAFESFKPDYYLLLNNDTVVSPEALTELVTLAESDRDIGLIGPKIYYYNDPDIIQSTVNEVDFGHGKIRHVGDHERDLRQYDDISETDYVQGSCLLVKAQVVEKIALLNRDYFCYWEDLEYCLRARRAAFRVLYCPTAQIWHKGSQSASKIAGLSIYYGTRNRFWLLREFAPKRQYITFISYYFGVQFWLSVGNIILFRHNLKEFVYLVRGIKDGIGSSP
jgi:GT2 family glycosyltransferase